MTDKAKQQMYWLGWLVAAISAAFSVGYSARGDWGELPARVEAIERWKKEQAEPALNFLVCRESPLINGGDPSRCEILIRDWPDLIGQLGQTRAK